MRLGATQVAVALLCLWVLVRPAAAQGRDLPAHVYFVANEGQWEGDFLFKLSAGNATYFFTETRMTIDLREYDRTARVSNGRGMAGLDFEDPFNRDEPEPVAVRGHVLKMNFVGANAHPEIVGEDKLSHYSNYFLGNDSCKWRSRVSHYQKVIARDVWNGIDVEFVADAHGVKTNYHVQPMADLSQIQIEYEGLDQPLRVNGSGDLVLTTSLGDLKEQAPWGYQIENYRQQSKEISLRLLSDSRYGFSCETFNAGEKLVIDPLLYSSYFGADEGDGCRDIVLGTDLTKIILGTSNSDSLPVTPGAYQDSLSFRFIQDGFVVKLTPQCDSLMFCTYIGGAASDNPWRIAATVEGSIVIVGYTQSMDWPVTPGAPDSVMEANGHDGLLSELSADGTRLIFSTYLGGSQLDLIWDAALDRGGNLILTGETHSADYPVTQDALFEEFVPSKEGVLTIFDMATHELVYSSYLIAEPWLKPEHAVLSADGGIWIGGSCRTVNLPVTEDAFQSAAPNPTDIDDGFVMLLDATRSISYCSYLGGSGHDYISAICRRGIDSIIVAGLTYSSDFPVTPGTFDTIASDSGFGDDFISVFSPPGEIRSSSCFGSRSYNEYVCEAFVDNCGAVTVVGTARRPDFPVTPDGYDTTFNDNPIGFDPGDIYLVRFSPDLTRMEYGTFLGGRYSDDPRGAVLEGLNTYWIVGATGSPNFPTTPDALYPNNLPYGDGFIVALQLEISDASPKRPHLPQNHSVVTVFPNPWNTATTIEYTVPTSRRVKVQLVDVLGRETKSFVFSNVSAGTRRITLEGSGLSSGIYFFLLTTDFETAITKSILIK